MMVYAITYDLNRPGQNYPLLYSRIESLGLSCHALQNLWFVDSQRSAIEVRDYLKTVIDSADELFVVRVNSGQFATWMSQEANNWLTSHV